VLVDAAQGSVDAIVWAGGQRSRHDPGRDPWGTADTRLRDANAAPNQVQVAWIKVVQGEPARYGEFPCHVQVLVNALEKIVRTANQRYPNLRIIFLSSRIYGGYAITRQSPEPYAYESAFAIRSVIAGQSHGEVELPREAVREVAHAPVLLWGPYLWADGQVPRKRDGLTWAPEDFHRDGTHPTRRGQLKVANQLLKFFTTNEFGKEVFLQRPAGQNAS
jgi:hypothetical protein